ncbi:MAG: acetolactate decarboxylase [Kiritimatiellae bacterium]|nr:acetolactate decarboxylase [Kiritimatiellia bacterium]
MKGNRFVVVSLATACAALLLAGCVSSVPFDQITRWPAAGVVPAAKDAAFPAYELHQYGNLGAGTLASGAGDMALDGIYYYQFGRDGAVYAMPPSEALAAGWAVRFRPDRVEALPPDFSRAALDAMLEVSVPDRSVVCALRLVGRFETIQLDGGPLLRRVSGTIFGLRTPPTTADDRSGSPQLWFLSGDLLTGGRIADFRLVDGSLALDLCPRYLNINPGAGRALRLLRQ